MGLMFKFKEKGCSLGNYGNFYSAYWHRGYQFE